MDLAMKIHPAIAAVVIVLTVVAIAGRYWGEGQALRYGGPSQLLRDPSGQVYVQVRNQLLEHDADGRFIARHDLGRLGAPTVIGALAFFSDGEVLLRRGADRRSLWNRIAAFRRRENTSDLTPATPDAGLVRCDLRTRRCRPFAQPSIDFKSTFGVFIDWRNDDVYVSDTSRHTLRKYSADGQELARPRRGFRFPNQLLLHDERLLVADTNHHQLRIVDPHTEAFAESIQSISVVPPAAQRAGHRWPSHFARIGSEWWINDMDNAMRDGGVYVFDDAWNYLRRIPLPADADPIAILPFAGGALISDWDNDRVYRVSAAGTVLGDFESPGLDSVVAESRERRRYYRILSWTGPVLLGVVIIGVITPAIARPAARSVMRRA